jgi:tripartite-type tricarboxylate transporter receptor subunit TctC
LHDVVGGHVEFGITPIAVGMQLANAGQLKIIGIANEKPLKGAEKYPLMNKYAPGLNIHGCWNLVLPKGTPQEIQDWYAKHFVPAIRSKAAEALFEQNYMFSNPIEHTPAGVRAAMERLRSTWQPIARKVTP